MFFLQFDPSQVPILHSGTEATPDEIVSYPLGSEHHYRASAMYYCGGMSLAQETFAAYEEALLRSQSNLDTASIEREASIATGFADASTSAFPGDYGSWLWSASLYTALTASGLPDTTAAQTAIYQAKETGPTEPEPFLVAAQFDSAKGNSSDAKADLMQALALQPGYPDARALLQQLPQ